MEYSPQEQLPGINAVYFSPLFGEVPFIPVVPKMKVTGDKYVLLPCYAVTTNPSYSLWTSIYPLLSQCTGINELLELYKRTSPATLSLLKSLSVQESQQFFRDILPIIFSLSAIHSKLFTDPILLPTLPNSSLTLNRLQVASLFALSFLGLFRLPIRFKDATVFPHCL